MEEHPTEVNQQPPAKGLPILQLNGLPLLLRVFGRAGRGQGQIRPIHQLFPDAPEGRVLRGLRLLSR